jgi:hypothetical protein
MTISSVSGEHLIRINGFVRESDQPVEKKIVPVDSTFSCFVRVLLLAMPVRDICCFFTEEKN